MRLPVTLLSLALGFAASFACTQENTSHCANLDGDATCILRGYNHCNTCISDNNGCQSDLPPAMCWSDGAGSTAESNASASSSSGTQPGTSSSSGSTGTGATTSTSTGESSTASAESSTGEPSCGNGAIDEGEDCDGTELGDNVCAAGGTLTCAVDCTLDMGACDQPPSCSNNMIDEGEQCDGTDFGDMTCETFSSQYAGGALTCNANCTINTESCCVADFSNCSVNACCAGSSCSVINLCGPD